MRSSLGLAYLLLGVMKDDRQFVFQSIQHLKAAVRLTKAESEQNDDIDAVQTAAMHNLGLAYISLDGLSEGVRTDHFLDWVTSLQQRSESPTLESAVFSINEGALLLQMGKIEDSITSLESAAGEVCTDSLSGSSRQKETCATVNRNLALARSAPYKQGGTTIHDKVALWNADEQPDTSSETASEPEPREVTNVASPSDDDLTETTVVTEGRPKDKTSKPKLHDTVVGDKRTTSDLDVTTEREAMGWGLRKVRPEMQNALEALEGAIKEGPQRTRLLLALARARASAGDSSGAVDAALKAISAATSDQETESSTSYLESLMEDLAVYDEGTVNFIPEEDSLENTEMKTSVESNDISLNELQLKLDIERLKNKVLQQEIMLGRHHQNLPQYKEEPKELWAIDYQQDVDTVVPGTKSDQFEESVVTSKITTEPLERETVSGVIQDETSVVVDEVKENEDEVLVGISETNSETQSGVDVQSLIEAVVTDVVEENSASPTIEGESAANDTATLEEVVQEVPSVESIQLPSLFEPAQKQPDEIS